MQASDCIKKRSIGRLLLMVMVLLWSAACSVLTQTNIGSKTDGSAPKSLAAIKNGLPSILFSIQVGAFSSERNAAAYAFRLYSQGLDAYHFIDTDGLHKVRFDRFSTRAAANRRAQELKAKGVIDVYYIVRPMVYATPTASSAQLRDDLLKTARRFIGNHYQWGGTSAKEGFDCSGLTSTVYRLNGLDLPRSAHDQYQEGEFVQRHDLRQGDLLFFSTNRRGRVSHVGIYCGDNTFIHAPGSGKRIQTASLSDTYFTKRYIGARRYF